MARMPTPGRPSLAAREIRSSVFARLASKMATLRGDLYPLHLGDTHLLPPEPARLPAGLDLGVDCYRYSSPAGAPALLEAVAQKLRHTNGLSWVEPAHLQITSGATHGLYTIARAVLDAGDEVLLPSPYWPLIQGIVQLCGARPKDVPLSQLLYANGGEDPRALLEPFVTDETVAIYVTSPNNPDGKVLTRAQLERIADLARDRNLWVLSDEVYEDYQWAGGERTSIASLPGMAERTITAFSFSKSHAMAGLRVGYVVGPADVIAAARKISNHTIYSVPLHVQRVALQALAAGDTFTPCARAAHRAARDEATAGIRARFHAPEGASYLFLDLRELLPPDAPDAIPLLERALDAGVLLAPGEAFGGGFERHARMCFTAVTLERLREAIARLNQVFDDARRAT
jgi:aspartate/methionine/tyrosine aminotransferase